jgi:hypothetical protein
VETVSRWTASSVPNESSVEPVWRTRSRTARWWAIVLKQPERLDRVAAHEAAQRVGDLRLVRRPRPGWSR